MSAAAGPAEDAGALIPDQPGDESDRIGDPTRPRAADAPAWTSDAPRPVRVLVVDDDPGVRLLAVTVLRRLGYTVDIAGHGADALAILERGAAAYDLVLSDVTMPELGGRALAAVVRMRWPAIGIVLMSGDPDEHAGLREPELRDAFLAKPFAPHALGETVRAVLDQRSGRPSNASSAATVARGSSRGRSAS